MKPKPFVNTSPTLQKRRAIAAVVALTLLVTHPLSAQSSAQTSDSETAKLKQQIEQLKQENQQLRQALTETPAVATTSSDPE